jgi:hypothetical protein
LAFPLPAITIAAMTDIFLVPPKTTVTATGDGAPVELAAAGHRVFLLSLEITAILEQQSLDVSIWGSADGSSWGEKALAAFPQKFYAGSHPLLLDLRARPEVRFLRAHWEVARWGRGEPTPRFEFHLGLQEVPPQILEEAAAEARALTQ